MDRDPGAIEAAGWSARPGEQQRLAPPQEQPLHRNAAGLDSGDSHEDAAGPRPHSPLPEAAAVDACRFKATEEPVEWFQAARNERVPTDQLHLIDSLLGDGVYRVPVPEVRLVMCQGLKANSTPGRRLSARVVHPVTGGSEPL